MMLRVPRDGGVMAAGNFGASHGRSSLTSSLTGIKARAALIKRGNE